jgi:hypothetical protein
MNVSLPEVIARGRRRLLRNALTVTALQAASAAMGGFVLVLLLGADLVSWRWLAILPAIGLAAGVVRACRRRPTGYATARLLDERLHLADTLSTAIFYWSRPFSCAEEEEMRLGQRRRAIDAARGIDPRTALPMRIPRCIVLCLLVMTVLAGGLALLHYRVDGTLDLRRPAFEAIAEWRRALAAEIAMIERSLQARNDRRAEAPAQAAPDGASAESQKGGAADSEKTDRPEDGERGGADGGQQQEHAQAGDQRQGAGGDPTESGQHGRSSRQTAAQPGTGSSLMSKLSDSLANLASALKPNESGAAGQRGETASSGNQHENRNGAASQPHSAGDGQASQMRASQSAGATENSSGSNSATMSDGNQPAQSEQRGGNGAGSDDGKKAIELAKQLEAMGKISVIVGKRSENVTGNATVDVTSGRPQVMTPYEARRADHAGVTASNDRDRIPIEFEAYVQQYFRELRKHNQPRGQKK